MSMASGRSPDMAAGGRCPECKYYLFVKNEKWEPCGVTVWYECANGTCNYAVKKFISNEETKK